MKIILHTLLIVLLLALGTAGSMAQDDSTHHDSVSVYLSWEAIFDGLPDEVIVDPSIAVLSPYEVGFATDDPELNDLLSNQVVVAAIGDTLWLVNTAWMQKNFKGDCRIMNHWVPLYFNAKAAFVQWSNRRPQKTQRHDEIAPDNADVQAHLYLIDFDRRRVGCVTHKLLNELLESYPDLQWRYAGMKDYKKPDIIQYFFLEYLERLNADPNVPNIIN